MSRKVPEMELTLAMGRAVTQLQNEVETLHATIDRLTAELAKRDAAIAKIRSYSPLTERLVSEAMP